MKGFDGLQWTGQIPLLILLGLWGWIRGLVLDLLSCTMWLKRAKTLKLPVCPFFGTISPCKNLNFVLRALGLLGFGLLSVAPLGVPASLSAAAVEGADLSRLHRSGDG